MPQHEASEAYRRIDAVIATPREMCLLTALSVEPLSDMKPGAHGIAMHDEKVPPDIARVRSVSAAAN
jgi:hypothetical protein